MASTLNPDFSTSIRGISKTAPDHASLEDYTITDSPIFETVADQNGAVATEMVYDHKKELTMTMHAAGSTAPALTGDTITFDSKTWQVDSVAEAGSFQNVTRWTVTAHRYDNFPAGA